MGMIQSGNGSGLADESLDQPARLRNDLRRNFTATVRLSLSSSAWYTFPIWPAPIMRCKRTSW